MYKLRYKLKGDIKWETMRHNFRKKIVAEKEGYKLLKGDVISDFQVVEDIMTQRKQRYTELSNKYKYDKRGLVRLAERYSRLDMEHIMREPKSTIITYILDKELPVRD